MSEMIERVARAIKDARDGEPWSDEHWAHLKRSPIGSYPELVREAVAAIEAMHEPTDAMAHGAQATGMGLVTPEARKEMFRAMITAALNPTTPPST